MEAQYTDRFLKHLLKSYWPQTLSGTILITRELCNTKVVGTDADGCVVTVRIKGDYLEVSVKNGDISLTEALFTRDFIIALTSLL